MPKLLYIGCDRTLAEITAKMLQRRGYDVLCAVGAEEATAAVHLHKPDVVVADFDVNRAEGSTFCGLVKQMAPMRLLFISASQDDEINLLNAGADDWMKQPYKMSVLYARIQALLRMA